VKNLREGSMRFLTVCLVLLFAGITSIVFAQNTYAEQGDLWSDGRAVVLNKTPQTLLLERWCTTFVQDIYVTSYQASKRVCMYGDERLRIGNFNQDGANKALVQFPFSNDVYVLEGICGGVVCLYSPDEDLLVTRQPVSQIGWGLVVYKNVSSRIKRDYLSTPFVHYIFNSTNPDYVMKNDVGIPIVTPSFAISGNGKWIVAEMRDKGIVRLNTGTLETRHVGFNRYLYGFGTDPELDLAISNNGKSVAVAGLNAGLDVIDVTTGCGQELRGNLMLRDGTVRCRSSGIEIGSLVPGFRIAERPRFYGQGDELEMNVASDAGVFRVTFGINGTVVLPRLKLLSLGDSFSSGEGETDDSYYISGTNSGYDTCHVSKRSYAALFAIHIGLHEDQAKNIACSGARITDVVGSKANYWGQGNRLRKDGIELPLSERDTVQKQAVERFVPGRALQLDFIQRYHPEIITIGIGGNDAGLMGKLNTCAMPGTCEWATPEGIGKTAGEVKRLSSTLESLFSNVSEVAGDARILVVGYPNIVDPQGTCDPITALLFDAKERIFIQQGIAYLNQVIRSSVNKAGFTYVDIEDSFKGKELCSISATKAMNGIRIGNDITITSILPMLKVIGAETFHPTPVGHALVGEILGRVYDATDQPDVGFALPTNPPEYWSTHGIPPLAEAYTTDFVVPGEKPSNTVAIEVSDGRLQPGSNIVVELRSHPLTLATLITNDNGGLKGLVTIPESVEEGFHTLHLYATNKDGKSIDMYQFITVSSAKEVAVMNEAYTSNEKSTSSVESDKPISEIGVLGVGTQNVDGVARSNVPASSIETTMQIKVKRPWGYIVIISVAVVVSGLSTILLKRRWAKPSS